MHLQLWRRLGDVGGFLLVSSDKMEEAREQSKDSTFHDCSFPCTTEQVGQMELQFLWDESLLSSGVTSLIVDKRGDGKVAITYWHPQWCRSLEIEPGSEKWLFDLPAQNILKLIDELPFRGARRAKQYLDELNEKKHYLREHLRRLVMLGMTEEEQRVFLSTPRTFEELEALANKRLAEFRQEIN